MTDQAFDELLLLYMEDLLPEASLPILRQELCGSPTRFQEYLDMMAVHAMLQCRAGFSLSAEKHSFPWRRPLLFAAAAAALLLFTGTAFLLSKAARSAARATPTVLPAAPLEKIATVGEKTAEDRSPARQEESPTQTKETADPFALANAEAGQTLSASVHAEEREESSMNKRTIASTAATAAASALTLAAAGPAPASAQATGATSGELVLTVDAAASIWWHTLPGPSAAFDIRWPEGATNAVLTMAGMEKSASWQIMRPAASATVSIPAPKIDTMETDAYRLSLAFDDPAHTIQTATLGNVGGVADRETRVVPSPSGKKWRRVQMTAVLPVYEGDTSLQISNSVVSLNGEAGWYGWKDIKKGVYALTLGEKKAEVEKVMTGFVIMLR